MVNDRACDAESRIVYKILTRADWEEALRAGRYGGSQDDVRDVIAETLIHEVGHYFGLSEEEIEEIEERYWRGDVEE